MSPRGRPPGTQQHRRLETSDDGGFDADRDRAAVDDQVDAAAEVALAHGPPWSARRGPTGSPRAPPPARRRRAGSASATGCAGTRIATVSSPAVARSATAQSAVLGSTRVSGPGQNACASAIACASKRPIRRAAARSPTWAISGIEGGPALGLVEPGDRRRVAGVGAEAIDGLGRERDQPALPPGSAPPPATAASPAGRIGVVQAHIHGIWRPQFGFLQCAKPKAISRVLVGVWLSPVEHCVRDAGVAGSNPATPTRNH